MIAGKPLVQWTIEAAISSRLLSRVIVSTDDANIADVARSAGAEVPFVRPAELATDLVPSLDVILHAAAWEAQTPSGSAAYMMCLHATSPLRSAEDIDRSIALAREKNADSVIGVLPANVTNHPLRAVRRRANGTIAHWIENDMHQAMAQQLPEALSPNGAILLARTSFLIERRTWFGEATYPYLMPAERSVDVDGEFDLRFAELLLASRDTNECPPSFRSVAPDSRECGYR
jgi:N-acylneuraminate cytidylyltransferase/CMP-N,N'-diacetyllegionaminic acid synthase